MSTLIYDEKASFFERRKRLILPMCIVIIFVGVFLTIWSVVAGFAEDGLDDDTDSFFNFGRIQSNLLRGNRLRVHINVTELSTNFTFSSVGHNNLLHNGLPSMSSAFTRQTNSFYATSLIFELDSFIVDTKHLVGESSTRNIVCIVASHVNSPWFHPAHGLVYDMQTLYFYEDHSFELIAFLFKQQYQIGAGAGDFVWTNEQQIIQQKCFNSSLRHKDAIQLFEMSFAAKQDNIK